MSEVCRETVKRAIGDVADYEHYYSHVAWCGNCGQRNYCYVLRGHRLNGLDIECHKCDCTIRLKSHMQFYSE